MQVGGLCLVYEFFSKCVFDSSFPSLLWVNPIGIRQRSWFFIAARHTILYCSFPICINCNFIWKMQVTSSLSLHFKQFDLLHIARYPEQHVLNLLAFFNLIKYYVLYGIRVRFATKTKIRLWNWYGCRWVSTFSYLFAYFT